MNTAASQTIAILPDMGKPDIDPMADFCIQADINYRGIARERDTSDFKVITARFKRFKHFKRSRQAQAEGMPVVSLSMQLAPLSAYAGSRPS
ncbi:hypothetical protein [Komagataeibacter swingsii]|uniref:Uncharacterized protein n=1 Tax=Komagataeibacter swingsii TaxID=215220 RepID=A0A850PB55_9PROT|nr:hypothetical protein [Komagataeibacter swingsii]NVN38171.1 hypothetical protein [Komagataeibacter swingsii]